MQRFVSISSRNRKASASSLFDTASHSAELQFPISAHSSFAVQLACFINVNRLSFNAGHRSMKASPASAVSTFSSGLASILKLESGLGVAGGIFESKDDVASVVCSDPESSRERFVDSVLQVVVAIARQHNIDTVVYEHRSRFIQRVCLSKFQLLLFLFVGRNPLEYKNAPDERPFQFIGIFGSALNYVLSGVTDIPCCKEARSR
jgi:hypothetical protein